MNSQHQAESLVNTRQGSALSAPPRLYPKMVQEPAYEGVRRVRLVTPGSETSRSSTPITDNSSQTTRSSASSWEMSAHQESECNFPSDDEEDKPKENLNGNSDGNLGDSLLGPNHRQGQNSELGLRQRPLVLQNSSLRNSSAMDIDENDHADDDFETSESECESYDDDDNEDQDDDWSGEDGTLEATVIAAVDGDLDLAAFLIPLIHKDFNSTIRRKVESWQYGAASSAGGSAGGGAQNGSASTSPTQSSPNSRKRQRLDSSQGLDGGRGNEEEEDDEDGELKPNNMQSIPQDATSSNLMLACPFHKLDPIKYSQHNTSGVGKRHDFRACAGPGFKSIQRLKEHLKRRHFPVQCDRCYRIFQGTDRAMCVKQLTEHRQLDRPCDRKSSHLKEGISEAQWATLEKQNRKRNQESHRVEKWFEIWAILFPGATRPQTPWYDGFIPRGPNTSPSANRDKFVNLFETILNRKMQGQDIVFPAEDQEEIKQKLRNLVESTFNLFTSLHGPLSPTTDSSSSLTRSNDPVSIIGGSSTHVSRPSNGSSQQLTGTTVSSTPSGPSQSYTLNVNNTTAPQQYPNLVPMARQRSQFQTPLATQLPPALQQQVPLPTFTSMPTEEMSGYYPVFPSQQWPFGVPYQTVPGFHGNGQLGMNESEFYNQAEDFAQGTQDNGMVRFGH